MTIAVSIPETTRTRAGGTTTIVVPCRHEEGNVGPLLARLATAMADRQYEVIFVDDSDDTLTVDAIRAASTSDSVRAIYRTGEARWGGLAGAVIDGIKAAAGEIVVVMDADLQHPPEVVPALLDRINGQAHWVPGKIDLVMASRYRPGGSAHGLAGPVRRLVSAASNLLAKVTLPFVLRGVTDPMTGFFAVRRESIDVSAMAPRGFKILLEILARYPRLRRAEVPLRFAERESGDSKGDVRQGMAFLGQLARLRLAAFKHSRAVQAIASPRYASFAFGGLLIAAAGAGILEWMIALGVPSRQAYAAQLVITLALNFTFNAGLTWRDRVATALRRRLGLFVVTRLATLAWSWIAFVILTDGLHWHHQLANVLCLAAAAVVNFRSSDRVVFGPDRRGGLTWSALALLGGVVAGLIAVRAPGLFWLCTALLAVAAYNAAVGGLEVRWRLYGWRTPEVVDGMRWPTPTFGTGGERFSLIVPALREADVIAGTLDRLLTEDYPQMEIVVSLCEGDDETIAEVRRVMSDHDHHGRIKLVIQAYPQSNKPRQLNAALATCTGTVVGVIDAEDDVAPGLLARVDALFASTGADVVQGGVQLMTVGHRLRDWFKVHNALEYFFWFTSRMTYQVRHGFVPLGGNTVFIRRAMLEQAGGWPDSLTEDCALGVILCTQHDAKVVAAYEPAYATREEVPATLFNRAQGSLFWQRVRWNQGFLNVLLAGHWRDLPTPGRRTLAAYLLGTPFLQAASALLLPLAVITIVFVEVPVAVAMLLYVPFVPILITLVTQLIGLREFGRAYRVRVGLRHYAFIVAGMVAYQWILMAAAVCAVVRHLRSDTSWYKTAHTGEHREAARVGRPILEVA